ncbi:uncharacterized protein LOC126415640 [Schistocerca serialis cubense]|uniref:uncharacterized protein LOC126415640 n=1 Tax=Schistocerca serialis cubense TaxID=2023355 RepID=UPI00214E3575|nr:uncharacterized protein LOC126415640 [Schistocerca serialis cubense]
MRSSGSTMLLLVAVGTLLLVGGGSAAGCDRAAVQSFDANKYQGVWYEIARLGEAPFEEGGQCITAEYTVAGDNNVTVHNRLFSTAAGAFNDIIGWAEWDDPESGEAKFTVHFPGVTENSWILSRSAPLTAEQEQQVNDRLESLGLTRSRYTDTPQDPQQCTVRDSTCDRATVTEFDTSKYQGVWYEIARFGEAPFEEGGQCTTAEYTVAGDNNVTVHNRLFSAASGAFNDIIGWAEFDDPDSGEAKLTVHFPGVPGNLFVHFSAHPSLFLCVLPVTGPYWVLDTDYDSYSIVWACREPTDETSNITENSWILSRSAQLTAELEQQVNDKLEALGLPRSRYKDTPQDPQQCTVRVSTCDKAVVTEFDTSQYQGVWYEIARLGEAPFEEGGQCITAEYTVAGENNVTVHNRLFSTAAGAFNDIIGWAEWDDPESGEAKFTVHFPGVPGLLFYVLTVTGPYWVLDTDYESYSIVWACREPADETSNITENSWILSWSAQLTDELEQQVNDKLEALGLIRSRYTDTPQDPQQCTVRVSTCDKAVVTEFDTSQYQGVWYEIARLGEAPFEEGGQCITAEYTVAGDNNVTVHNRLFSTAAGAFNDIIGWAEWDDPDSGVAKFTVHFPGVPENSWILSRSAQLTAEQEQQVNDKLEALGLLRNRYIDTPQDPQQCTVRVSTCDKPAAKEFDISKYQGVWYEIARLGEAPFEEGGQCITAEYTVAGDNNVTVHNRLFSTAAGAFNDIIGWAEWDDPDSGEAKFTVHFPGVPVTGPYWVLDTDYETYSVVWACREPTDETSNITENSWILSRSAQLTTEQEQQVNERLEALGLPRSRYTDTPQDSQQCNVTVSTCDKPAVTEFDTSKYQGVWYEIARLGEAPFEEGGQCITAEYTVAGDNNVTVHNRLFSTAAGAFNDIIGWAELDDPDSGEAKLTVHFPGVPVTGPYWVLDTDYDSYSIVWACREPTDETSNITENSWILSRSAQLTDELEQQVNDRLEALCLTRSRYTDTTQDPQQCSVRVSTCDKAVVTEFDTSQYQGVWYEIARLGEAPFEEGGQCITAEYTVAGENNVTVHNRLFSTAAGAFNDIIGWAEWDDPESGEAKFTVHFPGVPENSWILSRRAQLTEEQEQQVNGRLEALDLPRSRYTDTPQDPQQCTVRVSTCDKPAATEFDTSKYQGVWYEIARLGEAPFEEGGQCITAEYTVAGENNVTVHNRLFSASTGTFNDIIGWAESDDPDSGEAKFTVHFPGVTDLLISCVLTVTGPYWVLDTDYDSYSIVWACREPTDETSNITENSWLLSRTSDMSEELTQQVDAKLEELGLPRSRYTDTPQDSNGCQVEEDSDDGAAALGPAVALMLATTVALLFSL